MAKEDIDTYLATLLSTTPPELHDILTQLRDLYQRKLWHQLTLRLFAFVEIPVSAPYQVDLFERFVGDFASKLNQLRLVELGIKVSRQIEDPTSRLTFLTSLLGRISRQKDPSAFVLLLSTIAHVKLVYGDLEGTKVDMGECAKMVDELDAGERGVHAAYYGMAADYAKAKADYAPYYKHSLLYLACVNIDTDMSAEERLMRAHDLGISAFLGDTIYNFGELLMHPILDALDNTQYDWIKRLLFAFNEGSIGKFEALAPLFPKEPILQENYAFLRQKICLMALLESVFKRSGDARAMSFQEIGEETRLPFEEVEHLVMKALSLNLLKGSIDQSEQMAHFTWVQPRVLSRDQIGALANRLTAWCDKLRKVEEFVIKGQEAGDQGQPSVGAVSA